jgi:hypothetical protein
VADWALDHLFGLRAPKPELISLREDALTRFAGRYRYEDEEVAIRIVEGGLRSVVRVFDPGSNGEQTYPPNLLKPISEREFVVVTEDENEGAQADFIEGAGGAIRFLRMDGRLYDPVHDEAHG